jgi:hypothetical protein
VRMDHTCFGWSGGLAPISFPLRDELVALPDSARSTCSASMLVLPLKENEHSTSVGHRASVSNGATPVVARQCTRAGFPKVTDFGHLPVCRPSRKGLQ